MMPEWKHCNVMTRRVAPPKKPTGLFFAREYRNMSQDELARLSGENKAQISKLEHGQRELTRAWAERFAPALEMSPERIVFWDRFGPPDDHIDSQEIASRHLPEPSRGRTVKLKGYVGAGAEAHFYALADEDYEEVSAPEGAGDQTVAVEIKGTSMGPLLESWLVFYDDVRSPVTDDLIGKTCVVGLADDRILVKKITRNGNGGFRLLSNSGDPPIEDAKIEWAAKVTDLRPRI